MTRHLPRKIGSDVHTHPGLPFPHGLSQLGSPGLDAFHNAKSLHHLGISMSHFGRIIELVSMLEKQNMSPPTLDHVFRFEEG